MSSTDFQITRRGVLTGIAVTASGTLSPRAALADTRALLPGTDVCTLTPEVTEGPYYIDPGLIRRDIREDRDGVPTLVRMQVVDAACAPVVDARVDIWHCDAQGVYSAFGGDSGQSSDKSETFLRGTQMTDARGVAEFMSIYPGWYRGRTTHIHFKVFIEENTVLTGQIFFPDALSEYLYENASAYGGKGERETLNANDSIAEQATHASFAGVREAEGMYLAQLIVGVDPAARSIGRPGERNRDARRGPPPGPPPGDGPPPGGRRLDAHERMKAILPGT